MTLVQRMLRALDEMETRPEMYASNVASLEAQYNLLLDLLIQDRYMMSDRLVNERNRIYHETFGASILPMWTYLAPDGFPIAVVVLRSIRDAVL